jgi:hypothetical protein
MKQYLLVTGTSAADLERRTGIQGRDTDFGVFAEEPKPVNIERMMEKINDVLDPNRCKCRGVMHNSNCRMWCT